MWPATHNTVNSAFVPRYWKQERQLTHSRNLLIYIFRPCPDDIVHIENSLYFIWKTSIKCSFINHYSLLYHLCCNTHVWWIGKTAAVEAGRGSLDSQGEKRKKHWAVYNNLSLSVERKTFFKIVANHLMGFLLKNNYIEFLYWKKQECLFQLKMIIIFTPTTNNENQSSLRSAK